MNYSEERVNEEVINELARGVREYWKNEEKRAQERIEQESEKNWKKEIDKNEKWYSDRKKEDKILILAENLKTLKGQAVNKNKIDELYKLILDTQNEKARKAIGRESDKYKSGIENIYNKSIEIIDNGKVKRPSTIDESVYYVGREDEGFTIGKRPNGDDAYSDIIKTAFINERKKAYITIEHENQPTNFVEKELQELEDLEEYWKSNDLKETLSELEKENPKEAQKYKSSQIKRMQKVSELRGLYEDISTSRDSLNKVDKAIMELKNNKDLLLDKVYNKVLKKLEAQKKKVEIKNKKQEQSKNKIFDKWGLRNSINNSKKFKEAKLELKGLTDQQVLKDQLTKLNLLLEQSKEDLRKEYEKSEVTPEEQEVEVISGDVYETGGIIPASTTNKQAIIEAEEKVRQIKSKILEQENRINLNNVKREQLEDEINKIAKNEITQRVKGKRDEQALPEGSGYKDSINVQHDFKERMNFVGVNEKEALAKAEGQKTNKDLENEIADN